MANSTSAARETARDAREAFRESGKVASEAADDIQADLNALREDVADLAKQLGLILSNKGNSAWHHAKSGVEDTISDLERRAREAGDDVSETITNAMHDKPFTMLAVAAGLGFIFGATWRR
jgi:ElaB/YqjD/DUF883 family membrane-anchored ribosome-binding protein